MVLERIGVEGRESWEFVFGRVKLVLWNGGKWGNGCLSLEVGRGLGCGYMLGVMSWGMVSRLLGGRGCREVVFSVFIVGRFGG